VCTWVLRIEFWLKNQKTNPHGLLGQTAHHTQEFGGTLEGGMLRGGEGEGVIEGNHEEYIVSDMFGDDFKYNRYTWTDGKE